MTSSKGKAPTFELRRGQMLTRERIERKFQSFSSSKRVDLRLESCHCILGFVIPNLSLNRFLLMVWERDRDWFRSFVLLDLGQLSLERRVLKWTHEIRHLQGIPTLCFCSHHTEFRFGHSSF